MNSDLKDKMYEVPENLKTFLGNKISYHNLKMTKTRMEQAKEAENFQEFKKKGGEVSLKWIDNTLSTDRDALYQEKKTGMDAGRENQFIKKHEKDRDNANPTGVGGLPKMNKGNINRKIMTNKEVYNEGVQKQINDINYLIEYMDNKNNKKQKL